MMSLTPTLTKDRQKLDFSMVFVLAPPSKANVCYCNREMTAKGMLETLKSVSQLRNFTAMMLVC